jgi:hypothetical protein
LLSIENLLRASVLEWVSIGFKFREAKLAKSQNIMMGIGEKIDSLHYG